MCEMAASIVPSAFRWSSASDFHRSAYAKRSQFVSIYNRSAAAARNVTLWTGP